MVDQNLIFLEATLYILAIVAVGVANVYFLVRRAKNIYTILFHAVSAAAVVCLFLLLVDCVSFLSIEDASPYAPSLVSRRVAAQTTLLLCAAALIVSGTAFLLQKNRRFNPVQLMPDLRAVFYAIEDLVMIFDYNGKLLQTNNDRRLGELFGGCSMYAQIEALFVREGNTDFKLPPSKTEERQFEVQLTSRKEHYYVTVTPVLSGTSYLGFYMLLHNVTGIKASESLLEENIERLKIVNRRLANSVNMANVLAEEKERLKFSNQIQKELIVDIEAINEQVKSLLDEPDLTVAEHQAHMTAIQLRLRNVFAEVRKSIRRIGHETGGDHS